MKEVMGFSFLGAGLLILTMFINVFIADWMDDKFWWATFPLAFILLWMVELIIVGGTLLLI